MKKFNFLKITAVLVLALVGFSNDAFAATWTGAVNNEWNEAGNWDDNAIPSSTTTVIFNATVTVSVTGSNATCKVMNVYSNREVIFNIASGFNLTVSSSSYGNIRLFKNSILTVGSGVFNVTALSTVAVDFRTTNNTTDVGGTFKVLTGATANVSGTKGFSSINGTTVATTGEVDNSGVLNVLTTTGNGFQLSNNARLILTNNACGVLNLGGTGDAKVKTYKATAPFSTITNYGLITHTGTSTGISLTGPTASPASNADANAAFNYGFFEYPNATGVSFASGTNAYIEDNGVDIDAGISIDAGATCSVDFTTASTGMQAYAWIYTGSSFASNLADGTLDLNGATFPNTGGGTITISDADCLTNSFPVSAAISNVCSGAVPVELLSFSAEQQEANVLVSWATATEENNDFFTVEKSIDGKNFEVIGTVQGAGFSLEELDYEFVDENPIAGINYYRLKQTDFDGQFEYFDIKSVDFEGNTRVTVYPNPATNNVVINTTIQDEVTVQIFNLTGQLVYQNNQRIDNQLNVNLSDFANGTYLVRVTNSATQAVIYQDKLIKQ